MALLGYRQHFNLGTSIQLLLVLIDWKRMSREKEKANP